ncbi:heparan-sulfate 6-O-sulfotransferase 1-A-like, partial [Engraulis encrasicolus]|uniref:heparan-sulfate 6-O-sulfotransferase 1-A-like n=1 Tax=Engraulis encrasicolus TaxID=184585 RepID=UPI002FD27274
MILQELCKLNHGRDEDIPIALASKWKEWLKDLEALSSFKTERCYKPAGYEVKEAQLHHFCNASENGYGTVSYLRLTSRGLDYFEPIEVKKFYYITLLRDPVSRYLSEWRHVQRGATWKTSLHMCDGRTPTPEELPACYDGTDWSGCTLQQFMDCPYNLANNRQVRMLADLSLVGCYNMSFMPEKKRAAILLESAKKNLRDMAFFGLTEFQRKTQFLFERTFRLRFIRPFIQYNSTRAAGVDLDNDTILRIEELNELDMQLYDYAWDLFQQRYQYKRQLERRQMRLQQRGGGGGGGGGGGMFPLRRGAGGGG